MALKPPLARTDFEHLIPHGGAMCLLARVVEADPQRIRCEADSHRDPSNPLRNANGLPITAGIEYAAQAMALHAAVGREEGAEVQGGSIAVLSDISWRSDRLDDVDGPLNVEATLLAGTGSGKQYSFAVGAVGAPPLITGVVIVALG